MNPGEYEFLSIAVEGSIVIATMNRPKKLNATSHSGHKELGRFLRALQEDESVNVAVLAGAGRAFSVGGDREFLRELTRSEAMRHSALTDARELVHAHIDCEKPVIAAVNGVAMGSGLTFALLSDVVIAEKSARFADGHTRGGIAAGDGGTIFWPLAVGMPKAKRFLLLSDWISADEAERIGLVTEVVEDGQALERAMSYAHRLDEGPQLALRRTKRALNQILRARAIESFEAALIAEFETFATSDAALALDSLDSGGIGAMPSEMVGQDPTIVERPGS